MDSSSEEEKKEAEKKASIGILIGAVGMFLVCLGIGVLDSYHYLDTVLDFLHIPK